MKSSIPSGAICLLTTNIHEAKEDRVEGGKKDETEKKPNSSSKIFIICSMNPTMQFIFESRDAY